MTPETSVGFGTWLRQRRRALNLTQDELAQRVGCSTVALRKMEAEERRPSEQTAHRLAEILDIPLQERPAFVRFARGELLVQRPATVETAAPWQATSRSRSHLPAPLTSLIGRAHNVLAVRQHVLSKDTRLLTLIGPPGIGKTRLALQVATELDPQSGDGGPYFPDGVYFIPLDAVTNPDLVAPAIAGALGIQEMVGVSIVERLKAELREKRTLLVLDNFEQVVIAGPLLTDLLMACPQLKIMTTSRASLHVYGEHLHPVPPLALPPLPLPSRAEGKWSEDHLANLTAYSAIALFLERARAVYPAFQLTEANASAVVAICTRLDGLPLAIELIAARANAMSPQVLSDRLRGPFALSADRVRGLSDRQLMLRNAIGWSYELLMVEEQALFMRLGVFVGGCTLDAAVDVACPTSSLEPVQQRQSAVEKLLDSLCDKSLLQREIGVDSALRYSMLETLRAYAVERLEAGNDADVIRQRHTEYFLKLAEAATAHFTGEGQMQWLDRLERDHGNFRASLSWALDHGEDELALRLCAALGRFWQMRSHLTEGRQWFERVLALDQAQLPEVRAKVLNGAGTLALLQSDYSKAQRFFQESLTLHKMLEDAQGIAVALNGLGQIARHQSDYARATRFLEESLALISETGNQSGIARLLNNLGLAAMNQYDFVRASAYFEESLRIARKIADQSSEAVALLNFGRLHLFRGEYQEASGLLELSLAAYRELGDKYGISYALNNLGQLAMEQGEFDQAVRFHEQSLALCREIGNKLGMTWSLLYSGQAEFYRGDLWRAAANAKEGLDLARAIGEKWGVGSALNDLARVALGQGNLDRAARLFEDSLGVWREVGDGASNTENLVGLAGILLTRQQAVRAVRLLSAAQTLRESYGVPMSPAYRTYYERWVAAAQTQLSQTDFAAAWAMGQSMTLDQAIDYALTRDDAR